MSSSAARPPAVSVVMPVLDPDARFFTSALRSVLDQSFPDFELVVVEDPGRTSAADALRAFPDPRVRLIRNPTRTGLTAQLNRGLSEARAELIAPFDADAVCDPDRLRVQVEFLAANSHIGVVGSDAVVIDERDRPIRYRQTPTDPARIREVARWHSPFVHPSVMYRKSVAAALHGYTLPAPGEDYDFFARAIRAGVPMANLPVPLVHCRVLGGRAADARLRLAWRRGARVKRRLFRGEFRAIDWAYLAFEHALLALPHGWAEPAEAAARTAVGRLLRAARAAARRILGRGEERRHPRIAAPMAVRQVSSDADVYRQVIENREYDFPLTPAPRVIVDAGANTGLTSVHYANAYPSATIVAVEPDAANFEVLRRNAAPYPNVRPVRAALWSESRPVALTDPGLGAWGFRVGDGRPATQQVPGVTLDRLLAEHALDRVDLLKVDIEGAEREVFDQSAGWIGRVDGIVIETHDRFQPGSTRAVLRAARDFAAVGARGELLLLLRRGGALAYTPQEPNPDFTRRTT